MHSPYGGMRLPAWCSYNPCLLTLSVVFAIGNFRWSRCGSRFVFGRIGKRPVGGRLHVDRDGSRHTRHALHGMAAARFTPSAVISDTSHPVSTRLSASQASAPSLCWFSASPVLTSAVGRRFSAQPSACVSTKRSPSDYSKARTRSSRPTRTAALTYFNPAAERIFGYFQRPKHQTAAHPADARTISLCSRSRLKRLLATREARLVGRASNMGRRKNGNEFPLSLSLLPGKPAVKPPYWDPPRHHRTQAAEKSPSASRAARTPCGSEPGRQDCAVKARWKIVVIGGKICWGRKSRCWCRSASASIAGTAPVLCPTLE